MVKARLHVICGNCGSNDMFKHKITEYVDDDTNISHPVVYIICENCSTLHDLDNNSKLENK